MQKQSFELIQGMKKNHKVHAILYDCEKESRISFFAKLSFRVSKMIKENPQIQLIHCNDGVCGVFCRNFQKKYNIPVVVSFHGLDLLWPNSYYQAYLKNCHNRFQGFICVSDYTASECIKRGMPQNKVYTCYNGVDSDFGINHLEVDNELLKLYRKLKDANKRILISIGRPVKRKGFSWFIKNVFINLPEDNYHYIIVGPSNFLTKKRFKLVKYLPKFLRDQVYLFWGISADEIKINDIEQNSSLQNFDWLKTLNYDSLKFALSQSDLYVMPNLDIPGDAEGFGLVALEANMAEQLVFASNVDGIPSAVHDSCNGKLISPNRPELWENAILEHFKLSELQRTKMSLEANKYAKHNFSWQKMVGCYEDCFKAVIKEYNFKPLNTPQFSS